MHEFVTEEWRLLARTGDLGDFDALWQLDIGWFEEPNKRRGGWSGVSRLELDSPGSTRTAVFIKRQQNHLTRTWRQPLQGITTFRREFDNLQWLYSAGVPTLDVLYFAERTQGKDRQAILVTRELTDYVSLADYQRLWLEQGLPHRSVRNRLMIKLAGIARQMHEHHVQHNCFMPKHLFIRALNDDPDIRLLDLEKAKRALTVHQATLRDLDTLNRRISCLSTTDRLRFLLAYCGERRVNDDVRSLWVQLVRLMKKKSAGRQDRKTP